jgi:thioredoxin reductase (NADPH)
LSYSDSGNQLTLFNIVSILIEGQRKQEGHIMVDDFQPQNTSETKLEEQMQAKLAAVLREMPHAVPIVLFTDPSENEVFSEGARQIIRAVREMAPQVTLKEFDVHHKEAGKWQITRAPTLLFDPEHYHIRWVGAPLGEEGRTFVETLFMLGYQKSNMSAESKKILSKIDEPRDIKVFVSASCPYCPQQAVNAVRAAIERPDQIHVELIDIQADPKRAELYSAQGVPQVYANDILIAQGAQGEEIFMASLEKLEQQTIYIPDSDAEEVESDLVIVGGGPAGLTAGIYASRGGLRAVIIERGALGGQVATTPVVENYPGLTQVGGKSLVDIMVSHALQYTQIFPGEEVMDVQKGKPMVIHTSRRRFLASAVLLATGATYRHLGVPGEAALMGHGVSYCSTCDGPLFKGKNVIIVGGGDSAVTEALHLKNIGVDVTLVHRRDTLRAQAHLGKSLKDANIPVRFNSTVQEIRGEGRVQEVLLSNRQKKKTESMKVDGVFIAVGYIPAVELARKIGIELTAEGYIKRDDHHRTNIPGIYSAGDVEGGYKQIVTAAGQGAEAAMTIYEDLGNPYWKRETSAS